MYGGRYGANRLNLFYRDEEQTRKLLHDYLAMREREVDGVCALGRPASPSPESDGVCAAAPPPPRQSPRPLPQASP